MSLIGAIGHELTTKESIVMSTLNWRSEQFGGSSNDRTSEFTLQKQTTHLLWERMGHYEKQINDQLHRRLIQDQPNFGGF